MILLDLRVIWSFCTPPTASLLHTPDATVPRTDTRQCHVSPSYWSSRHLLQYLVLTCLPPRTATVPRTDATVLKRCDFTAYWILVIFQRTTGKRRQIVTLHFRLLRSEPRAFWGGRVEYEEVWRETSHGSSLLGFEDSATAVAPPSPDYLLGPADTTSFSGRGHERFFPAEEQPLPPVDSPTAESPGYVTESDPEEDPEEYEDDKTEDGPVDYPMDGGDNGDDGYDGDDDDDDSSGNSFTVRPLASVPFPSEGRGERLARCMAPPAHSPPLPPSSGCLTQNQALRIASTQALIDAVTTALPPPLLPPLPTISYTYIPSPVDRRDDIPESEQPPRKRLYLSTIGSRYEIGESSTARPTRGQGIDYGFVSTVDAEERRQGIRDVGYGIRDTWVDPAEAVPEIAPMTVGEVNTRVVELAELHERDTQDLYALLEDAQDSRSRISQRVDMDSQRVDLLMGDRMTLQETVWMVEEEAYASREAWAHSIGLSQATHQELQTHRDHVYAHETYLQAHQTQLQLQSTLIQTQHQVHETRFQMQQAELAALRETDRRRQDQMVETLRVIRDMRREMSDMQTELLALREQQRRARQPGPEARIPDHQDASGDADSHI
ncbi:hypothetical protein Tco_0483938 [Tanacetum coccineum]